MTWKKGKIESQKVVLWGIHSIYTNTSLWQDGWLYSCTQWWLKLHRSLLSMLRPLYDVIWMLGSLMSNSWWPTQLMNRPPVQQMVVIEKITCSNNKCIPQVLILIEFQRNYQPKRLLIDLSEGHGLTLPCKLQELVRPQFLHQMIMNTHHISISWIHPVIHNVAKIHLPVAANCQWDAEPWGEKRLNNTLCHLALYQGYGRVI